MKTIAEKIRSRKTENRRRKTEAGGQKTEDRRRKTEAGGQKTEDRGRKTEDGGQKTEDRGRKTEAGGQKPEDRGRGTEDGSSLCICDCGVADYRLVLQLQHQLCEKRRQGKVPNMVLIAEHPPVITLGARQSANKLLVSRSELAERQIDVVDIRRGGGTTAHNPGQLVFYPILHLQQLKLGISEYIRELEAIGIELLKQLGVRSRRRKGLPGLWVAPRASRQAPLEAQRKKALTGQGRGDKKIASIGVRVSKFVTYHGMAINIQNDLSIFDFFVPCGLDDVEMTSVLKETGRYCSMSQVREKLSELLIEKSKFKN